MIGPAPPIRDHRPYLPPAIAAGAASQVFAVVQISDVAGETTEARLRGQCDDLRRQVEVSRVHSISPRAVGATARRAGTGAQAHCPPNSTTASANFEHHPSEPDDACRGSAETSETRNLLKRSAGNEGAIDEVRQITMDLRPSILDDLGILSTHQLVRVNSAPLTEISCEPGNRRR